MGINKWKIVAEEFRSRVLDAALPVDYGNGYTAWMIPKADVKLIWEEVLKEVEKDIEEK